MDGRKLDSSEQALVQIESFYKGKIQSWQGKLEELMELLIP